MGAIWHALSDPWHGAIVRHALLETALIGVSAGPLGCWVIFFRLSYSAESLAHAMFPGLVVAALTGAPLILGGAAGVLVAAVAIGLAARVAHTGADVAVAVVITALFGLGVLLALSPSSPPGIQGLLFGDILGTSSTDLVLAAGLAAIVVVALRLLHWRLLAVGFDPPRASALGASPLRTQLALMVLLALSVVVAVEGLGTLLVVAVLVAPAASARRLSSRMGPMMLIAAGLAVASGWGGLYLSYYANVAAGAAIALVLVGLYLLLALLPARTTAARRGARSPLSPIGSG